MDAEKLGSKVEVKNKVFTVYGYTNFRTYLKDFYEFRKDGQRGFSYLACRDRCSLHYC